MLATTLFPEMSGAVFSPCGRYRYRLWRTWDTSKPGVTFVMLNPSKATEIDNDPTVERCQRRAVAMGFGSLRVANLFALQSTDPSQLYRCDDPVGPDNDAAILTSASDAGLVIAAWGTHGNLHGRAAQVVGLLVRSGVALACLGVNADGTPKHPLYISYEVQPAPYLDVMNNAQEGA